MNLVNFRGMEVMEGWPEKLAAAQKDTEYQIGDKVYPRIPNDSDTICHDCAAIQGEYHVPGCDVEQCPKCGGQSISCGCDNKAYEALEEDIL